MNNTPDAFSNKGKYLNALSQYFKVHRYTHRTKFLKGEELSEEEYFNPKQDTKTKPLLDV